VSYTVCCFCCCCSSSGWSQEGHFVPTVPQDSGGNQLLCKVAVNFVCLYVCFCTQKSAAFTLLGIGFSITAWLLQYLWQNIEDLLLHYSYYIAIYFVTAGVISFAVCYYRGPVTNPRLLDLIRWTIQLFAIVLIYYSSQIAEISATIIALVVLVSAIPRRFYMLRLPSFIMRYWYLFTTAHWCIFFSYVVCVFSNMRWVTESDYWKDVSPWQQSVSTVAI